MGVQHILKPGKETLHNCFSREIGPALAVKSGDRILAETPDCRGRLAPLKTPEDEQHIFSDFHPDRKSEGTGHTIIGPVKVEGAKKGQTLAVHIQKLVPETWGWVTAGGVNSYYNGRLATNKENPHQMEFDIDPVSLTAKPRFREQGTHQVPVRPFLGLIGMPPDEPGKHPTVPPRYCGGNIDCKALTAGSTLYLPISVDGAMLSFGDGHAVQGDGEVAGPALECGMSEVELTLEVLDRVPPAMPFAETEDAWIAMGYHESLDDAMYMALNEMLDFMCHHFGFSRSQAQAYASMTVDLRVTQIVNQVKGIYAVLKKDALKGI